MEKVLFAADELTGLIWAAAKMRPSKSTKDMEVSSLKKKFKDKKFAAGCSRDVIIKGAENLGWDLPKLMEMTLEEMEPETGAKADLQPDQLASILFTSGTTGKSKGVMLTHRNLAENATCLDMKFPERSVLLSVLPVHHAYCLSMDILKVFQADL